MKPFFNISLNNKQSLQKCEGGLLDLLSLWLCQLLPGHFTHVRTMLFNLITLKIARVFKEALAGLLALVISSTANRRIFIGLGLMGVAAPLSGCFYMVFSSSRTVIDLNWYHLNYFHLFYLLGPYLCFLFFLMGIFLLFPQGSKRAYFLSIPTGFVVGKILWLWSISSNEQLWQIVPSSVVLIGIIISATLYLTLDWLTWRKFHRADAFEAREKALFSIVDDVPPEKFLSMWKMYMIEKKEYHKQF